MGQGLMSELLKRRIPQILGVYLGVAWGAIQVVDWATSRYLLSSHLVDLVVISLLSLLPAVLVLAYMHGAPGRDRWTRLEKVVLPLNIGLTLLLLTTQMQGKDLGRVAKPIQVVDEAGQTVERLVPTQAARRKVGLFFWENASGDPDLDWLRMGLPIMLEEDLEQDLFVSTRTPLNAGFIARLQEAGFDDGLGAPVSLQRQVARRYQMQYFASGTFDRDGEGFKADLTVYSTDPAREVGSHSVAAKDPMQLADRLSVALKPDLEVHKGASRLADDLPVAEHLSAEVDAIRDFVQAATAIVFSNDYAAAIKHLDQALAKDPSFTLAHVTLARVHQVSGNSEAARKAIKDARKHEYRLKERDRFVARAMAYQLDQQYDKLVPLHEQWVEIYPEDVVALRSLAGTYLTVGNRVEDALRVYRRLLEVAPGEDKTLLALAQLLQAQGENEEALEYLRRYAAAHPESDEAQIMIGQLHWNQGEHAEAKAAFEKASLLVPSQVQPQVFLGLVEMAEGKIEAAEARYLRAEEEATTPGDKFTALQNLAGCYLYFGRVEDFSRLLPRSFELGARSLPPVQLLPMKAALITRQYLLQGRVGELAEELQALKDQLSPPLDVLIDLYFIEYFLEVDEVDNAEQSLQRFERFLEAAKLDILSSYVSLYAGKIAAHRGENAEAARLFEQALVQHAGSILSGIDLLSPIEMLVLKGRANREDGKVAQAEESLNEALRRFPAYPRAHLELAKLYQEQPAKAKVHLDRLLDLLSDADDSFVPLIEARELAAAL